MKPGCQAARCAAGAVERGRMGLARGGGDRSGLMDHIVSNASTLKPAHKAEPSAVGRAGLMLR